jgi:hypothetical protein
MELRHSKLQEQEEIVNLINDKYDFGNAAKWHFFATSHLRFTWDKNGTREIKEQQKSLKGALQHRASV